MGICKRLMAEMEAFYPESGCYQFSIGAKSIKNIAFYEKIGYLIIGREPVTANLTLVKMEKQAATAKNNAPAKLAPLKGTTYFLILLDFINIMIILI